MKRNYLILLVLLCAITTKFHAQDVELFQQFNGQYDYIAFGNTLNLTENTTAGSEDPPCEILTQSSAPFALDPSQTIVAAYLYWAGSGTGDLEILLNGIPVTAQRTFSDSLSPSLPFFAAFADVTSILQANGNGMYTVSELDLTDVIAAYCGNTTNFGGWSISVVYEDASLPLNQLSIFDGLQSVSSTNNLLTIVLENLNVLDNIGAKIGFTTWEGDASLSVMETLQINGNIISNPPLNPVDNAFNSTNSFTGSNVMYNMDIDFYNIENNISPGDTNATISLTSGQDFVMINNVITVLNSELPDATIEITQANGGTECGNRMVEVAYSVFNLNSTDALPANTPIAFYANNTLIGQAATVTEIPINGEESGVTTVTIPASIPATFELKAFVDDTGGGVGIVNEILENNNGNIIPFTLLVFPDLDPLLDIEVCDAVGIETFNLNDALVNLDNTLTVSLHLNELDALANENPITSLENFINTSNPQEIFVRADNGNCQITDSFMVQVVICPLPDATVTIDNNLNACRRRDLTIEYTVYNTLGTAPLPANTNVAFYISGQFVALTQTQNTIPIGGSESGVIDIAISENVPDTFTLLVIVDNNGTQQDFVEELDETNNTFTTTVIFEDIPPIQALPDLVACDTGLNTAVFDLTSQDNLISNNPSDVISYFTNPDDAIANTNPIEDPAQYENAVNPQGIFVRLENEICFTTSFFQISTENCPPFIPQGFSPNNDGINDVFEITGLIDVFENFELQIFSREGNLIYQGNNNNGFWDAIPNTGLLYNNQIVPTGTYYYVLVLNDAQFPDPFTGFVYINY